MAKEEENILKNLKELNKPIFLVINKIDRLKSKNNLLPIITDLNSKHDFEGIIPVSALRKDNITELLMRVFEKLPLGEFHYSISSEKELVKLFSFQKSLEKRQLIV